MPYVTSWERIAKREGKREGKTEGIREGKLDTARRMLNQDYSLEDIEKCTGLTIDEIKSLMN
jgi:predicted transposase/invertase (TIGR01784 family)